MTDGGGKPPETKETSSKDSEDRGRGVGPEAIRREMPAGLMSNQLTRGDTTRRSPRSATVRN